MRKNNIEKFFKTKTEVIAWGGLIFGAIGIVIGVLSYNSSQEQLKVNRELEANQYLYQAMDLLGAVSTGADTLFVQIEPGVDMPSHERARELEKARRFIEKYEAIRPNDPRAHIPRFIYYVLWNDIDKAKMILQKAQDDENEITDADIYVFMGLIVGNKFQDNKQAIKYFEIAIRIEPNNAKAHAMFGVFLHAVGMNDRSINILEKANNLDPNNIKTINGIAHVLSESNRIEESMALLKDTIQKGAVDDSIHNTLGTIYSIKRRYKDAVTSYKEAIHLNPTNAIYYHNLSLALRKLGRLEEAVTAEKMRDKYRKLLMLGQESKIRNIDNK